MIKKYKAYKKQYRILDQTKNDYDHPAAVEEEAYLYRNKHASKPNKYTRCNRLTVYPKDIAIIYGVDAPDFACELFMEFWETTGARIGSLIFAHDFCKFTGFDEDVLRIFFQEGFTPRYRLTINQAIKIAEEIKLLGNKNNPMELYMETGDIYDNPDCLEEEAELYLDIDSPVSKEYNNSDNTFPRFFIYPRDIAIIFGDNSPEFIRYILMATRKKIGAPMVSMVCTVDLFEYTGLDMETINDFMRQS